jgi:protein-L-isoaspartate(D-aspartate) O-methyltransferase
MVHNDIARRGVSDPAVLDAMHAVPRHRFVPAHLRAYAYDDTALPIAACQTISEPFIVARMTEALELRPTDRVLEVGTGSGYGAAVLGRLAAEVFTIERIRLLADEARQLLDELGNANVHVVCGDGSLGWPEHAPYDAIAVTASGPRIPDALLAQLADGGRLVMPIGLQPGHQKLVKLRREGDGYVEEDLGGVVFVPLVGEQGWPEP